VSDPGERDRPATPLTSADLEARRAGSRRALRRQRQLAALAVVVLALGLIAIGTSHGPSHVRPPLRADRAAGHGRPTPHGLSQPPPHPADPTIDKVLSYTSYLTVGSPRRAEVALTFDDGPGPDTPHVLAILARYHVPATFFTVGAAVRRSPKLVRQEVRRGYAIGDHTERHAYLSRISSAAQSEEILGDARDLEAAGAPAPQLFRPPYGAFDATTLSILRSARMLMVLWTVDTKDFSRPGTQRIVYTAISGARPGAVILMHDGGGSRGQTVDALPRIIARLRHRGFRFVTVPQLLRDDPPPAGQPPPHPLSGAGVPPPPRRR